MLLWSMVLKNEHVNIMFYYFFFFKEFINKTSLIYKEAQFWF